MKLTRHFPWTMTADPAPAAFHSMSDSGLQIGGFPATNNWGRWDTDPPNLAMSIFQSIVYKCQTEHSLKCGHETRTVLFFTKRLTKCVRCTKCIFRNKGVLYASTWTKKTSKLQCTCMYVWKKLTHQTEKIWIPEHVAGSYVQITNLNSKINIDFKFSSQRFMLA